MLRDGSSNTLMVGEKGLHVGAHNVSGEADGAVGLISYNVDDEVFRRMSLSKSGLPADLP